MRLLEEVRADIRSGVRYLRENLVFTIVAVLTLAVGIGTTTVVFIGMGVGVAVAFVATRWVESMLFDVSPNDPWTIMVVASIFIASATAATWLPARRASRIHPMTALRYE